MTVIHISVAELICSDTNCYNKSALQYQLLLSRSTFAKHGNMISTYKRKLL